MTEDKAIANNQISPKSAKSAKSVKAERLAAEMATANLDAIKDMAEGGEFRDLLEMSDDTLASLVTGDDVTPPVTGQMAARAAGSEVTRIAAKRGRQAGVKLAPKYTVPSEWSPNTAALHEQLTEAKAQCERLLGHSDFAYAPNGWVASLETELSQRQERLGNRGLSTASTAADKLVNASEAVRVAALQKIMATLSPEQLAAIMAVQGRG